MTPSEAASSDLLALTQHAPELLTAGLGCVSIALISKGSSRYGDLANASTDAECNAVTSHASRDIAAGSVGMMAIAFIAGNPLFAYPEITAVAGAFKPYIASVSPKARALFDRIRAGLLVKLAAIGMGAGVIAAHVQTPLEALPPLGLTALTLAFSGMRQQLYRILTISGGAALCAGSIHAITESMQRSDSVGAIMGGAFLTLNVLFTANELREVRRMGGVRALLP